MIFAKAKLKTVTNFDKSRCEDCHKLEKLKSLVEKV